MTSDTTIGVGPHPKPWPAGESYDEALLRGGDYRNVEDKYRYWKVEAIVADLDKTRHPLHVAIENWQHDFNIGTIVRSANAFNASAVHIIGRRHWNKRGAMATEKYLHVFHHETIEDFIETMQGYSLIAIDNQPGAVELVKTNLPMKAVLIFGGEGPGISAAMAAQCEKMVCVEQFGSTRSVNVGVAAGIVLYVWMQQHVLRA